MMIAKSTGRRIDTRVLDRAARVLRVLAHPHRLRIVEMLAADRLTVGQIADELDLAPHAASQHLNHMRNAGILEATRDGRSVFYRVVNPNALKVIECIRKNGHGAE